jgi:hypothetical protein
MPYSITGSNGSGFTVVNTDTGKKKNNTPYKTRAEAVKYMQALYAAEKIGSAGAPKSKPKPASPAPGGEPGGGDRKSVV